MFYFQGSEKLKENEIKTKFGLFQVEICIIMISIIWYFAHSADRSLNDLPLKEDASKALRFYILFATARFHQLFLLKFNLYLDLDLEKSTH